MKIRIVKSGKEVHVPRDLNTETFIAEGMWEEVKETPAQQPTGEATWGLHDPDRDGMSQDSKLAVTASCSVCGTKMVFIPKPSKVALAACGMWHCGKREAIPDAIGNEFIRRGGGQPFPVFTSAGGAGVAGGGFLKDLTPKR